MQTLAKRDTAMPCANLELGVKIMLRNCLPVLVVLHVSAHGSHQRAFECTNINLGELGVLAVSVGFVLRCKISFEM